MERKHEKYQRLLDFCKATVGRFKGGLAQVDILVSLIFSGMSGSAVADVSALGTFLIPQMERKGYDRDFATALTVSTAVVAPTRNGETAWSWTMPSSSRVAISHTSTKPEKSPGMVWTAPPPRAGSRVG